MLLLCALAALPARAAHADWHLTPFVGYAFQGNTTLVDLEDAAGKPHVTFGGAGTWLGSGPFGVEGIFLYSPGFFGGGGSSFVTAVVGSRMYALMGNVVVAAPLKWNEYGLRPFVSGGVGLLHASQETLADALPITANLIGYNVGGGAVGFITERTGLRFDLRYFRNLRPSDGPGGIAFGNPHLSYWTGTVGLVFRF